MATVTWDKLYPITLPHLPGCPFASVDIALAEAAAEFCDRTHVWRAEMDAETTTPGEPTYELILPATLASMLRLSLDGEALDQVDDRAVPLSYAADSGRPTCYALVGDTAVRFFPTPDAAYPFFGTVALKPSRAARGVESFIYETHANVLASGAIYRLALVPSKEWSNPALAEAHRMLFERGVADARIRDLRNIRMRVAPYPF